MSELPVVKATDLGKRYRRTWALRDCSLAVPRARVVAFVGPNGAGKTTLLHLAVGLFKPTQGGPGRGWVRVSASGKAAVQRLHGRRDAQVRARAQPGLDHE
jgi:ABC-2 type transport system ATP-binding protein